MVKPATAAARLQALQPFVSPELYSYLLDIFHIFKSIVTSLETGSNPAPFIDPLGSKCSYEIGKAMVLSTRASYYKLNNSILFDPKSLPESTRKYHHSLSSDIDPWLQLQPSSIFEPLRLDILRGYLLHVIVFNSPRLLYLLVPTLIHWLYEESIVMGSSRLKSMSNKLFYEFWHFDSANYYDNIGDKAVKQLSRIDGDSNDLFWWLNSIGYWDNMISSIGMTSSQIGHNQYEVLILDTLILNNKLMDGGDDSEVYALLRRNSTHLQVNNILITMLTRLIKQSSYNPNQLNETYYGFLRLIQSWLAFGSETPGLFNSLQTGNDAMFKGVISFSRYLHKSLSKSDDLTKLLILLFHYYTNRQPGIQLIGLDAHHRVLLKTLRMIQMEELKKFIPLKYSNYEISSFIYWLLDNKLGKFASAVFYDYYGQFSKYYDDDLRHIHRLIKKA
ncbi:hypothetical protein PSN45_002037 [Yamadazyma tenuis]|nr:hypothetical protein PSN45_002037 [Yamadazyma tenuis]